MKELPQITSHFNSLCFLKVFQLLKNCNSFQNFTVKLQLEGITIVFCKKIKFYKNGFSESEH
ncbi:conserved hypothetical protein [Leptospira interrogans serovar Copenhageni str. Fiocruz L1-130]|uniref:Uncharacterized protein n=1 Tax=Leptospira interrogans serogroup Icterohaemorrhagiae serovar copenhageni (strain Fiocruz L1-130) TaxID=267671 RepID=Q72SV3_LEPIC|nr:conserved hypothetical protein [Leptospira interrogans serovar Copenhageni str. Fiocruz L1-130]